MLRQTVEAAAFEACPGCQAPPMANHRIRRAGQSSLYPRLCLVFQHGLPILERTMFYLYHHHDLSRLADVLTVLRRHDVESPLAADLVLVPNTGLGRWLKMRMAEREGICANLATELPAPFFWKLVADSLPGERPDSSAYQRENLRWHLYALLPTLAQEVPEVANYLAGTALELRRWQLAERLAELFDQYLIYRRGMLLDWERGIHTTWETTSLPARWQAAVWRLLVLHLGPNHRARLLGEFVQQIESGAPLNTTHWPRKVCCFGLGNLPPDYLRLLYAIAQHTDVHFFMHNPSDIYWGDIEKRPTPRDVALDGDPLPGEEMVFTGHPLLASLGYAERDFLRLIYSDEFSGIRELEPGDVFEYIPPMDDSLLHRLQSGVIRMDATPVESGLGTDDHSLQIHACHGVLREVQVLHDQLLDLLARDPTLQPRDIIVMTPGIADFAPAIEAVFGSARGLLSIPYNTSDEPRGGSHPIVRIFRALLDLPLWRWTASEVIALLNVPAVMRCYELESAETADLERWIAAAGIRWGIDADHRIQLDAGQWAQNSWSFGMDRLLLGVAMSDTDTLADGVAAEIDLEGGGTAAIGQLWLLIDRLRHWRQVLPAQASAAVWQERLNALCADVFLVDQDDREERRALQTIFEAVSVLGAATDSVKETPLSWEAVREIIDSELEGSGPHQPFLAGGVSFCGLMPLRTVPFRVVCLLGMNEGKFPRQDRNRSINLIRKHPRLGDSSARDDDRLLFLQWLLAARDVFYISYTGQDTASGETLEPSTVVAELLDFMARYTVDGNNRAHARAAFITRQPMQPFSPRYFHTTSSGYPNDPRVFTYRGAWRPGTQALFGERGALPSFVEGSLASTERPELLGLDELRRFLEHPARYFLRDVLQLDLEIDKPTANDEESISLSALDRHGLRQRLFASVRASGPLPDEPSPLLRAQGVLPPSPLDREQYHELAIEMNRLWLIWQDTRPVAETEVLAIDLQMPNGVRVVGRVGDVRPEGLCRIEPRRLGARQLLVHWLDLLALAATGRTATLACCGIDKEGELDMRLGTIDASTARTHLQTLTDLYLEGQQRPLVFLPELGEEFVGHLDPKKRLSPDQALDRCNLKLSGDFHVDWVATNVWLAPVLAEAPHPLGDRASTSEFCRIACDVIQPLLDTLQPTGRDEWQAATVLQR